MTSFINIEFSNISKRYRRRSILDGVDFKLHKGQCTMLCGTNGSGKTTLLRIMAGLEKPDAGTINTGLGEINGAATDVRCRQKSCICISIPTCLMQV